MDELLADFIDETAESLDQVEADLAAIASGETGDAALNRIARALHTIKGGCGFLALPRIEALAHAGESALARMRDGRHDGEALGLLRHTAAHLKALLARLRLEGGEPNGDDRFLIAALATPAANALDWTVELAKIRNQLLARAGEALANAKGMSPFQRLAAAGRAAPSRVPIEAAWKTLPLIAQDMARALGKPIDLSMDPGDAEIERIALVPLKDTLGHLIRNCADHGIETPEQRHAAGKPEAGRITLSAARVGEQIVIRLADDGQGLDTARIRHRAISRGLVFASAAARMRPEEIHAFIFEPGFSTAEAVTRHSGRGVGLDVARANIAALGGAIAMTSQRGEGVVFTLTIPESAAAAVAQRTSSADGEPSSSATPALRDMRIA